MTCLTVKNLTKSYGKHKVLDDLSFTLEQGEIVGFIGPNGSGKSTTMKCIANLVFPDSGEINIAGYDLAKSRNKALSHLSALIEAPGLYYNLTGLENLQLFASLRGVGKARLQEVIEFTGLNKSLKKRTNTYSMGMKQRLALGIAILTKPTFLILDEPFSGLDPHGVLELREVIKNVASEGCGILFSSHQIQEMEKIAHRNIFIKDGRLVDLEQGQLAGSILGYKLFFQGENPGLGAFKSLKDSGLLVEYQCRGDIAFITLASAQHLSNALTALLNSGLQITGIVPQSTDIENLYDNLYERGAL